MIRKGNVLAIMSAKGGTGKTATTANLAAALATEFKRKILAVDTNITTASLGLHFGIDSPKITIYDVLKKEFPIQSAIINYSNNLDIIPASLKKLEIKNNEKDVFSIAEQTRKLVYYYDILLSQVVKNYDLVLLDSAGGFSFESLATMEVADGILFVTNPEYPALLATAKAVSYSKILGVPTGGIVLNKVKNKSYEVSSDDIMDLLKMRIAKKIPNDEYVPESISKGVPVVLYKKNSAASTAYKQLAGALIGEEYIPTISEKLRLMLRKF